MDMQGQRGPKALKEWIIFCLCLGLGGHLALGLALHAPERWPLETAWTYGFLVAMFFYIAVQLTRSMWWIFRSKSALSELSEKDVF